MSDYRYDLAFNWYNAPDLCGGSQDIRLLRNGLIYRPPGKDWEDGLPAWPTKFRRGDTLHFHVYDVSGDRHRRTIQEMSLLLSNPAVPPPDVLGAPWPRDFLKSPFVDMPMNPIMQTNIHATREKVSPVYGGPYPRFAFEPFPSNQTSTWFRLGDKGSFILSARVIVKDGGATKIFAFDPEMIVGGGGGSGG